MLDAIATLHAPEETAAAEAALVRGEIDLDECIRREFATIRAEHDDIVDEFVDRAVVRRGLRGVRARRPGGGSSRGRDLERVRVADPAGARRRSGTRVRPAR